MQTGADQLIDECELVDRARTDADAFAVLYRMHVGAVHTYAYRCCGSRDVAEDVTAATFERALRSLERFEWRDPGIRPWLLRLAATAVADHYRRERRSNTPRAQMILRELAASVGTDDGGPQASELAAMRAALHTLQPRHQEAITLRYLMGLSADEAAHVMDCSKSVLAVTLHRALGALRSAMARGVAA